MKLVRGHEINNHMVRHNTSKSWTYLALNINGQIFHNPLIKRYNEHQFIG